MSPQRSRCRGAVTVEMALVAPIVLTLLFGVLQVGHAFMVQHSLQDAARQGCRNAALRIRSNTEVTSLVTGLLRQEGIDPRKTTLSILINGAAGDVSKATAGDDVCVKITMAIADATLFPGFFRNFTGSMQGAVTLRCE